MLGVKFRRPVRFRRAEGSELSDVDVYEVEDDDWGDEGDWHGKSSSG